MSSSLWLRVRPHISTPRRASKVNRVRIRILRASDRALAEAMDQLRAGVPLNWSQVEDDPELATLSALQAAAWECRTQAGSHAPPELRAELFERLSARLPEPQPEPVKQPPKALAGFSEKVPVLTQAEEDVPPLTGMSLRWVGLAAALALLVLLVGLGVGVFGVGR